jgi:hypothetical protein
MTANRARWAGGIAALVSVMTGNFVFQAFRSVPQWGQAAERSWFQAVAVVVVLAALTALGPKEDGDGDN